MLPHTENRIWQLYATALAAKTPVKLTAFIPTRSNQLVRKRSVEVQINNLVCIDPAVPLRVQQAPPL